MIINMGIENSRVLARRTMYIIIGFVLNIFVRCDGFVLRRKLNAIDK
jgi:hypothetical protein